MFKRRKPLTLRQTIIELFWPSMGWRRSFYYVKHRLLRVADSTHKIALGLAIGMGVSFTPLLGTHFIQAGIISFVARGNIFSAMIGTFIGNPWTFPFFWWAGFSFGRFMFSFFGIHGAADLPDHVTMQILWDLLWSHPLDLFLPWMLGGYTLCFVSIPFTYFVYYYLVHTAKIARAKAKERRMQQVVCEVTGQCEK